MLDRREPWLAPRGAVRGGGRAGARHARRRREPAAGDAPRVTHGPAATGDNLRSGRILAPGGTLTSPNGTYQLTLRTDGNLVLYPPGTPGAVTAHRIDDANWVTAHEVGHVLGLGHTSNPKGLMHDSINWEEPPPDLSASEYSSLITAIRALLYP